MAIRLNARAQARIKVERTLRSREIDKFREALGQRRFALLLVTGREGEGKSSLLRAFQYEALAQEWDVVPYAQGESFGVDEETTEETFGAKVAENLAAFEPDAGSEAASTFRRRSSDSLGVPTLSPLVERLRRHTKAKRPTLILLDGYQPGKEFADWFADAFLPGLRLSRAAVVVAMAEERIEDARLLSLASEQMLLQPPDRPMIEGALDALAAEIAPPMQADERQIYLEEVAANPRLLRFLMRALSLSDAPVQS